jgi:hypothetical protein
MVFIVTFFSVSCNYQRRDHAVVDQEKMSDVDKDINPIFNKDKYDHLMTLRGATLGFLGGMRWIQD